MKNRLQLELSLSDILLEKINHKENFSVSTQSRFGTNINEVFHFDLKQKILYLNYSRKNYSGKTSGFMKLENLWNSVWLQIVSKI